MRIDFIRPAQPALGLWYTLLGLAICAGLAGATALWSAQRLQHARAQVSELNEMRRAHQAPPARAVASAAYASDAWLAWDRGRFRTGAELATLEKVALVGVTLQGIDLLESTQNISLDVSATSYEVLVEYVLALNQVDKGSHWRLQKASAGLGADASIHARIEYQL